MESLKLNYEEQFISKDLDQFKYIDYLRSEFYYNFERDNIFFKIENTRVKELHPKAFTSQRKMTTFEEHSEFIQKFLKEEQVSKSIKRKNEWLKDYHNKSMVNFNQLITSQEFNEVSSDINFENFIID